MEFRDFIVIATIKKRNVVKCAVALLIYIFFFVFSHFQFLWMDDADTVNNIMLAFISMPYVMVLDPTVHLYFIPEKPVEELDPTSFDMFLQDVKNGKVEVSQNQKQ